MRVLFTVNIPSPYRIDFFNELGKFCELTVLFESKIDRSRNKKWIADNAINFKSIFMRGIKYKDAEGFCPEIFRYLSLKKFDLIVIGAYHTPTGMMAIEYMNFRKIPFILSTDGGIKKADNRIKYFIKKHFISSAKLWLSTGEITNDYLEYYGAKKESIFIYPFTSVKQNEILNQISSREERLQLRKGLGIKEEKVIISVGQFTYRKGYDLLLKAWQGIGDEYGLYIIGGRATEEYINLTRQLNLKNVHFIDFMTKSELSKYYQSADLFVLPTREDIWGLVINEALSYGLPVITTDKCVAGCELVKNNSVGTIVSINNFEIFNEEFKKAINNCYSPCDCLKVANEYTIEKMAKCHIEIFNKGLNL